MVATAGQATHLDRAARATSGSGVAVLLLHTDDLQGATRRSATAQQPRPTPTGSLGWRVLVGLGSPVWERVRVTASTSWPTSTGCSVVAVGARRAHGCLIGFFGYGGCGRFESWHKAHCKTYFIHKPQSRHLMIVSVKAAEIQLCS